MSDILVNSLQQQFGALRNEITRNVTPSRGTSAVSGIGTAPAAAPGTPTPETAASDFAALLIEQLLTAMRKTVDHSENPLYGGAERELFDDLLYSEYAAILAENDAFGINDLISESLQR